MTQYLIETPNAWDAMQILTQCQVQIWDEIVAASCDLDSRREVIPAAITDKVYVYPGYRLICRVEDRVRQAWSRGDLDTVESR